MLDTHANLLRNSAYQHLYLGSGPWTTTGYTAPAWRMERTGTPTVTARMRTLDASSNTDKRLRGRRCIHLDVTAIDAATQDVAIRQRVDDAYKISENNMRLTVPVYGPGGATFTTWFTRGTMNAGPTFTTRGVEGGTIVTGDAQAGAAATITLAAGASASDDAYNGRWIEITDGTGLGQMRLIQDYDGATKVATVDLAWAVQPDATSGYKIANAPAPTMATLDEFTSALTLDYCTVQSFGKPSQTGTFMIGPADFQAVPIGADRPMQFCDPATEALRLADRYFLVRSGLRGRSSTTSLFLGVQFPETMRAVPTYVPLVTSDITLLLDTAGTLVPSTAPITNVATDITEDSARLALQNGWTLVNNSHYTIKTPAAIGVFNADYFA